MRTFLSTFHDEYEDMPFKLMRHSKFRHVYGKPYRRERCYDGINISRNAHDNNFCTVNPLFVAIVTESAGGGTFVVLPLDHIGRISASFSKICGHTGNVMDIKWDPFDDHNIASAAEDGKVRVWQIPDGGLTENMENPKITLNGHLRRCSAIEWHPTAKNILASAGYDKQLLIWNVGTGEIAVKIDCHRDIMFSLSFNWDGSRLATTCKDKLIRIIDPRNGDVMQEGKGHNGNKSSKCIYAGDTGRLISVGHNRNSGREVFLWDQDNLSSPVAKTELNPGTGVLFPYYDSDSNVLYVAGKGDSSIWYYEILSEKPYLFYLSQFMSSGPQRGLGFMPKRGVDMKINEVVRFYKVHASKNLCEPISMIVPRKGDAFQSDLYPDTASDQPALTAEQWLSGIDAPPHLMSLGGVPRAISAFPPAPTPAKVPLRQSRNSDSISKSSSSSSTSMSTSSASMSLPSTSSTMMGNKPTAIVTGVNKSERDIQPINISLTDSAAPAFEKENVNVNIKREDSETNSIKEKSERELLEKDTVNSAGGEQEKPEARSSSLTSSPARSSIFAQWKTREAESKNGGSSSSSYSRAESRKLRDHPFKDQFESRSRSSSGEIEIAPQQHSREDSGSSSFRTPLSSTSDDFEVERSLNLEGREVIRINMSPTRQPSSTSGSPRRAPGVSDSSTRRQMSVSVEPSRAPSLTDTNRRSVSVSEERPYSPMASTIASRFSIGSNGSERRNMDDEPLLMSKDMGMDQDSESSERRDEISEEVFTPIRSPSIQNLRKAYLRQQEEIKQLKSKILLKDQRIRQLERELEQASNESTA
ncbi:coronin-like protein cor-1 isoform X1 [Strongylocentrotus purpuratus]|uniref:Coronin n=2 Tax=Strongylocentrotus purpuratus TaxID=7668 RepID=A0A7M7GL96_STRPU|nr:coronin-like protein cor-1 isoform X1 [Strongylocentrotus purpuratus]